MSKINMRIGHRLTGDEALARIKKLLNQTKVQYADLISSLEESWDGSRGEFKLSAAGFSVSGTIQVTDSHVDILGQLPMAAAMFKGQIESIIREKANGLLGRAEIRQATPRPASSSGPRLRGEQPDRAGAILSVLERVSAMSLEEVRLKNERASRDEERFRKFDRLSEGELARSIAVSKRFLADPGRFVFAGLDALSPRDRLALESYALGEMVTALIGSRLNYELYEGNHLPSPQEEQIMKAFRIGRRRVRVPA